MIHTHTVNVLQAHDIGYRQWAEDAKGEGCLTQYNITDPKDGTIQGIYRFVVRAHAHPDLPEDSSDSEFWYLQEQCVQSFALERIHLPIPRPRSQSKKSIT